MKKYPFSRRMRLEGEEIPKVIKEGVGRKGRHVIFYVRRRHSSGGGRMAVVVGKKVGNAVVRNRLKRWCREYFRTAEIRKKNVDVVFRIVERPSDYRSFKEEIEYLLEGCGGM